jgi:hypothetical protein
MITLKSHSRGRKPETIVEGETVGLRDRLPHEQVHLRQGNMWTWCVMCKAVTGPNRPWMDNIDHWQDHPMRCR